MVTQAMKMRRQPTKKSWVDRGYPADLRAAATSASPTPAPAVTATSAATAAPAPAPHRPRPKLKKMVDGRGGCRPPGRGSRVLPRPPSASTPLRRSGDARLQVPACGSGRPGRQKVCVRECTTRDTEGFDKARVRLLPQRRARTADDEATAGLEDEHRSATRSTSCRVRPATTSRASPPACWNPDFEPRDPATMTSRNGTGNR